MRTSFVLSIVAVLLAVAADRSCGSVIYVNCLATGDNSGASWADAHTDLPTALDRGSADDEIWIAMGVYRPTTGIDRAATFQLKDGIHLFGGFLGTETDKQSRNAVGNPTVLSGNIGDSESQTDNVFRVVTCVNLPFPPTLDGLVIREGFNDRQEEEGRGGGIYNVASSTSITECVIEENFALGGAGIWNEAADPIMIRCVIRCNENNGVTNWKGGNPRFEECEFSENFTEGPGAAFNGWTHWHSSVFVRCQFIGNTAESRGGAYYGYGDPIFHECLFIDNKTKNAGGVAYLREGSAVFANCTAWLNRSGFNGGGIVAHGDTPTPTLTNCLIWNNRSKRDPSVENNQIIILGGRINYSCVEGWTGRYGGVGNFGDDPLFVDADKVNLHLRDDSPCFDAGDDSVVTQSTDLDGNPRILGARVDIGCYESVCPAIAALDLKCTNSGKLKATATTTLPEGATVRFTQPDAQGRSKAYSAAVNRRAKAVAKWRPDSDAPVCIEGCSHICAQQTCP